MLVTARILKCQLSADVKFQLNIIAFKTRTKKRHHFIFDYTKVLSDGHNGHTK